MAKLILVVTITASIIFVAAMGAWSISDEAKKHNTQLESILNEMN